VQNVSWVVRYLSNVLLPREEGGGGDSGPPSRAWVGGGDCSSQAGAAPDGLHCGANC